MGPRPLLGAASLVLVTTGTVASFVACEEPSHRKPIEYVPYEASTTPEVRGSSLQLPGPTSDTKTDPGPNPVASGGTTKVDVDAGAKPVDRARDAMLEGHNAEAKKILEEAGVRKGGAKKEEVILMRTLCAQPLDKKCLDDLQRHYKK